jgi:hypothetical protein
VCSEADVSAFVAACGDLGTQSSCAAWQQLNTAGPDGGGGTACGNCILDRANTGASFVSQAIPGQWRFFGPNYGACIQILDPVSGGACAPDYDALEDCDDVQCSGCAYWAYSACAADANHVGTPYTGACAKQGLDVESACAPDFVDGGVANACMPGMGLNADPDWRFIIPLICGSEAPDGSTDAAPDAAPDADSE